jgi:branched-chain amino acid aminotransferase
MPQYDKLVAYHNGKIVPLSEVRVSIFDNAIMLGDMIYEMTRTFNHKPFLLDRHLDRLETSLKMTCMNCGLSRRELDRISMEVLEANLPAFEDDVDIFIITTFRAGRRSTTLRWCPTRWGRRSSLPACR